VDTYNVGDELEGTVTKVVTFGAFVEIMDGVEGLVHISELAQHHVENPREVVEPGDKITVKILEIDSERRRLSLSVKRVEDQQLPMRSAGGAAQPQDGEPQEAADLENVPELGLSEDVFAGPQVTVEGAENLQAAVDASEGAEQAEQAPEDAEPAPEEPESAPEEPESAPEEPEAAPDEPESAPEEPEAAPDEEQEPEGS
jgi:small subunit ribosomal protein S1